MMVDDDIDVEAEDEVILIMPGTPGQQRVLVDAEELAALRAWKERAVPLLTELVDRQTIHDAGYTWCLICYTNVVASNDYTASCAAHKARALLAKSEASDGRMG